ncbi:response regulator transcription factor [Eubacteriales bacterium OttesenSCG-928-N14]|nr:response regulator transcription factor [Eubacteriales bacterium OttesenSCG-928-N14]
MLKILIVEDEQPIANLINMSLSGAGYHCQAVYNGREAADLIEEHDYDLILLDIMLPEIDGYELLAYIRPLNIPVIFLTAKGDVQDRVKGLKLGADDYLSKPFEIDELLARVEAVLRRYDKSDRMISIDDVTINLDARTVSKAGRPVDLTLKEYDLLVHLVQNKNMALFRETLFEKIWGDVDMGMTRTLDLHIQRLRKKLNWEDKIKTVYKVGYRLEV